MWKAMIWKECRECAVIVAVAAIAMLLITANAIHLPLLRGDFLFFRIEETGTKSIPFLNSGIHFWFILVSSVLAVLLGLQQTIWESKQQSWLFLLQRPMLRNDIIRAKLATGLGLYLILTVGPVLVYLIWALMPATHASPFFLTFTEEWWRGILIGITFYLASFFSGLRPGRWFGSRLVPLVAAAFFLLFFSIDNPTGLLVVYSILVVAVVFMYFQIIDQSHERSYP
jgi:hypothetical protein